MIGNTKIFIKGFPKYTDIATQFYNMDDLMDSTKIYVNDFPTFFSVNPSFRLAGFYNKAVCRLRINIKNIDVAQIGFSSYSASKMRMKSSSKIGISTYAYSDSKMKLKATGTDKCIAAYAKIGSKMRLTADSTSGFGYNIIKTLPGKTYCISYDKRLGYWDDFKLEEMDDLKNIDLVGTIVG